MFDNDYVFSSGGDSQSITYTDSTDGTYYIYNDAPQEWQESEQIISAWIDKDGNMTYSEPNFYTQKEKIFEEILMKLMNEIVLRKLTISNGLKYEILSLLKEIDDIEEKEDDGFIKEDEMEI